VIGRLAKVWVEEIAFFYAFKLAVVFHFLARKRDEPTAKDRTPAADLNSVVDSFHAKPEKVLFDRFGLGVVWS
jgi:hypothetical protein